MAGLALALAARAACADIYVYTDPDGAVSLSNVPTDGRYTVLIGPEQSLTDARGAAVPGRAASAARTSPSPYGALIEQVARSYGLDSALVHAVVAVESGYNARALSRKGAQGLMQLMPETARRYGVNDAFDPQQNLDAGARYLRDLLRLFHDDVGLALAAYNAGEAAVLRHGNRIPPYAETQRYVPLVLQRYERSRSGS